MYIRHPEDPVPHLPIENCFVAYADDGVRAGTASVQERDVSALIPERPLEYYLSTDGAPQVLDGLLGAVTTRALILHNQKNKTRARIYIECSPEDEDRLTSLRLLGFKADDQLIRMARNIAAGPLTAHAPEGTTFLRDQLNDIAEYRYFLERYILLTHRPPGEAASFLEEARRKPRFTRMLLIARDGLAGELICWVDRYAGVIAHIHTSPNWREKGVAAHLMERARQHFVECGVREAVLDVRQRLRPAMSLAAASGYRQIEVRLLYPGIDL